MIAHKKGICIDCPEGSEKKYLTAGRCSDYHYKKYRVKVNSTKKNNVEKKEAKAGLNVFFASQILQIPAECEECGNDLRYMRKKMPRALVAHILPKRKVGGFPTVATHPQNRMFFCGDCHTNFDQKGEEFGSKLKSLPLMRTRFKEFRNLLTTAEMQKVPKYLLQNEE